MNSNKKTARIAGILFLAATAAYILGNGLIESVLNNPDYLIHVYPNRTKVIIGMLLELVNSAAAVGIAITLFPILKKHNETIALGYVAFRFIGIYRSRNSGCFLFSNDRHVSNKREIFGLSVSNARSWSI